MVYAGAMTTQELFGNRPHLCAVRFHDAPKETLNDWYMSLGSDMPEAAKYWAYTRPQARHVRTPPPPRAHLLQYVVLGLD
jgi:hypothetical protein